MTAEGQVSLSLNGTFLELKFNVSLCVMLSDIMYSKIQKPNIAVQIFLPNMVQTHIHRHGT